MERAIHWLQVVVLTLSLHVPLFVKLSIELEGRKHAFRIPLEVSAGFKKVRLCDVRRVDKLVASLLVALTTVVLHYPSDNSTLWVEYG